MSVTVKMENYYEDGHESTHEYVIPVDPEGDLEEWFLDVVWEYTGDGHGIANPKLGCGYVATVIKADDPSLVGETFEWF